MTHIDTMFAFTLWLYFIIEMCISFNIFVAYFTCLDVFNFRIRGKYSYINLAPTRQSGSDRCRGSR